jgi:ATP-binding cassette subfamily G (WHITE) protein 2 (PDR)
MLCDARPIKLLWVPLLTYSASLCPVCDTGKMDSAVPFGAVPHGETLMEKAVDEADVHFHYQSNSTAAPTTTSPDSSISEQGSERLDSEQVMSLTQAFTQHSIKSPEGQYVNPFHGSYDPVLDPNSGKFNQRAWIKTLVGITSRDPVRYPKRVAGISYQSLNVHGFGAPTDYQKSFGNYPLEITGLFNKLRGKGQTKIQILRDFDGLVRSGEMLVVLGRPGRLVVNRNNSGISMLT